MGINKTLCVLTIYNAITYELVLIMKSAYMSYLVIEITDSLQDFQL